MCVVVKSGKRLRPGRTEVGCGEVEDPEVVLLEEVAVQQEL